VNGSIQVTLQAHRPGSAAQRIEGNTEAPQQRTLARTENNRRAATSPDAATERGRHRWSADPVGPPEVCDSPAVGACLRPALKRPPRHTGAPVADAAATNREKRRTETEMRAQKPRGSRRVLLRFYGCGSSGSGNGSGTDCAADRPARPPPTKVHLSPVDNGG